MTIKKFPPVETADEDGLLAVGGDLRPESVLLAYRSGIFPWPIDGETLAWFAPPRRGVLFLDEFHAPRRMHRFLKGGTWTRRRDTNFRDVILKCAEPKNRGERNGTWITESMVDAYCELFHQGFCHSFEAYLDDTLVGGLYGIQIGRFFAAESSFYRVSGASKICMCEMATYLRGQGITWLDCQMVTPFSKTFGAREIPRAEYMRLLAGALRD